MISRVTESDGKCTLKWFQAGLGDRGGSAAVTSKTSLGVSSWLASLGLSAGGNHLGFGGSDADTGAGAGAAAGAD
ncbi:hypothetical protein QCA50_001553 [Cerrena zonata]|uniref:Uncharacterized protein n=1 Tax=Cerrena zonata TaxID=2478898 RepID=A0AAW0GR35_9APHY